MSHTRTPRTLARSAALPIAGAAVLLITLTGCGSPAGSSTSTTSSTTTSSAAAAAPAGTPLPAPPFEGRPYADAKEGLALDELGAKRAVPCELLASGERAAVLGKELPYLQTRTSTNEWTCTFRVTADTNDQNELIVVVRPARDAGADVYTYLNSVLDDPAAPAADKARFKPLAKQLAEGSLTPSKVCSIVDAAGKSGTLVIDPKGRRFACAGNYTLSITAAPEATDAAALDKAFATAQGRLTKDVLPTLPKTD